MSILPTLRRDKNKQKNNGLNHVFRLDPTYKEVIQAQKAKIQAEIELGL